MDYQYQATNSDGQLLTGSVSAANERDAARQLRLQGLVPIAIESGQAGPVTISQAKVGSQGLMLVIQELATLLNAGVPLAEAVESIANAHAGSGVGAAFSVILSGLRRGEKLSDALRASELNLPVFVYQLVAAGELTGKLGPALTTATAQMEYEERVRQEMRNALTYPTILVLSGITAVLVVFIVVVPKFANLLKNGAHVPALSLWVIGTGLFVKAHLLWIGLLAAAAVMSGAVALGNPAARASLMEFLVRVPLLGEWLLETEVGRWASMLGALLENRVTMVMAMELAQDGVRIGSLRGKLQQVLREVRAGTKLADALANINAVGSSGVSLIRVGERSGQLATMLGALATLNENAGRNRMKRFLLLLEPAAILIIGAVIGVIMVAIMLAVTSMSNITL